MDRSSGVLVGQRRTLGKVLTLARLGSLFPRRAPRAALPSRPKVPDVLP